MRDLRYVADVGVCDVLIVELPDRDFFGLYNCESWSFLFSFVAEVIALNDERLLKELVFGRLDEKYPLSLGLKETS